MIALLQKSHEILIKIILLPVEFHDTPWVR